MKTISEEKLARIIFCGKRLLERIDLNGGLGEYNGGPAFAVKDFREAIESLESVGGEEEMSMSEWIASGRKRQTCVRRACL